MSPYKASPSSTRDGTESMDATPATKFTAFSPDERKPIRVSQRPDGVQPESSHADPFVSAGSKGKPEQKLSPTAQPFVLNNVGLTSKSSAPIPGTVDHVHAIIARETDVPREPITQEFMGGGRFTTDTLASRCLKIESIYKEDIVDAVNDSLKSLQDNGLLYKGSKRIFPIGNAVYLRLANIEDAELIYNNTKKNFDDLRVDYVAPSSLGQIISPASKYSYTAHEGQIVLRARFPNKSRLTENDIHSLLNALSIEGTLRAWRMAGPVEGNMCELIAEYQDSSKAQRACQRFSNATMGKHPHTIEMSAGMYRPDIDAISTNNAQRTALAGTPTRRSADASAILDGMASMNLNNQDPRTLHSGREAFTPLTGPSNMAYFAPSNAPFGLPSNGFQLVVANGGLYTQNMMPGTQAHLSVNGIGPQPSFAYPAAQLFYAPQSQSSSQDLAIMSRSGLRRNNATKLSPSLMRSRPNPAAGHHNHVDIDRIRAGTDVRTTVMLRNIPNKVDQAMLKSIVDESSHGKYDFMYLRIDFSNNCNVGYAFINFTDPLDIIDFVAARSNQKWHRFKSDKVAEVSYATIQGRDCLIQKFRNSSVMLEAEHYRPKLFFTSNDPWGRAGQEDAFPPSDNASKLKRSCENAEHVGLFAPSAGQHLRDEQRRRRSQYDRGTSLAEREEYGFDDSYMPSSSYQLYPPY